MAGEGSEIAFFDVEITFQQGRSITFQQGHSILEFGAILVCPSKLVELRRYSTLIRPADTSSLPDRGNGITKDAVDSAPSFADIAHIVYDLLHGKIWAGHNILQHGCPLIEEAFAEINRPAPKSIGTIDTLQLLRQKFGRKAGDMKLDTLASYFGFRRHAAHRALEDARMNLEVVKYCATVLFLKSSLPHIFTEDSWVSHFLEPDSVSIPSISVASTHFLNGTQRIQILHNNLPLQLECACLNVRFGISTKYLPRLSFVVDASPELCDILDAVDSLVQKLMHTDSGSSSQWHPVVNRSYDPPSLRLKLKTACEGTTEVYCNTEELVLSRYDVAELNSLFTKGDVVDACFSLVPYDFDERAGISLVANKLLLRRVAGEGNSCRSSQGSC